MDSIIDLVAEKPVTFKSVIAALERFRDKDLNGALVS